MSQHPLVASAETQFSPPEPSWRTLHENPPQGFKYDAQAIARYYRYRPFRAIWRAVRIVWAFAWFVLGLKSDDWFHRSAATKLKRAEQLRILLTRLGPTFIKVVQALSTRPDLVRKDFLEELVKLQDQLPPFPTAIAFLTSRYWVYYEDEGR